MKSLETTAQMGEAVLSGNTNRMHFGAEPETQPFHEPGNAFDSQALERGNGKLPDGNVKAQGGRSPTTKPQQQYAAKASHTCYEVRDW